MVDGLLGFLGCFLAARRANQEKGDIHSDDMQTRVIIIIISGVVLTFSLSLQENNRRATK